MNLPFTAGPGLFSEHYHQRREYFIASGGVIKFRGNQSISKRMVDSQSFSNVSLDYVNKRVTQQGEVDYFKITCTLKSVNGQK